MCARVYKKRIQLRGRADAYLIRKENLAISYLFFAITLCLKSTSKKEVVFGVKKEVVLVPAYKNILINPQVACL